MQQPANTSPPENSAHATTDFGGVKVALLLDGHVLSMQRDQKPGLRYASMWDLPGGGREGQETPLQTATREIQEELGFVLDASALRWSKAYPPSDDSNLPTHFMAFAITQAIVDTIVFGTEGQRWQLYTLDDFMQSDQVIPFLKSRLATYRRAMEQQSE
jgi:8-oxo-dGTP diphosphatase